MRNNNRATQTVLGALFVLAFGAGLYAQGPSPPPSRDMGRDMFFFSRMEEASPAKTVKGAPYSAQAITETNQTLSDGNQIRRSSTATLYRDSEGRTRREQALGGLGPWSAPQGKAQQIIRISDPVAGANYVLDPNQRTAQKMSGMQGGGRIFRQRGSGSGALPPSGEGQATSDMRVPPQPTGGEGPMRFEKRLAAEGGNVQTESLGSQVIEGAQADGTRTTMTIPAGSIGNEKPIQIVTERWYSNQLQAVVMSKRTDPRVGETIYRLTNINQTEPPAALFQVPSGYTVQEGPSFRRNNLGTKHNTNQ